MDAHESHQTEQHQPEEKGSHEGRDVVTIYVDDRALEIHRGRQPVAAIKAAAGLAEAYVLVEVVEGRDVPLADDAHVTIKGGEHFESHPREGGSS